MSTVSWFGLPSLSNYRLELMDMLAGTVTRDWALEVLLLQVNPKTTFSLDLHLQDPVFQWQLRLQKQHPKDKLINNQRTIFKKLTKKNWMNRKMITKEVWFLPFDSEDTFLFTFKIIACEFDSNRMKETDRRKKREEFLMFNVLFHVLISTQLLLVSMTLSSVNTPSVEEGIGRKREKLIPKERRHWFRSKSVFETEARLGLYFLSLFIITRNTKWYEIREKRVFKEYIREFFKFFVASSLISKEEKSRETRGCLRHRNIHWLLSQIQLWYMNWYTCIAKEGVAMLLSKVLEKKQDRQHENEMQLLLMLFVCQTEGGEAKKKR